VTPRELERLDLAGQARMFSCATAFSSLVCEKTTLTEAVKSGSARHRGEQQDHGRKNAKREVQ